jgi:hypothetical protein
VLEQAEMILRVGLDPLRRTPGHPSVVEVEKSVGKQVSIVSAVAVIFSSLVSAAPQGLRAFSHVAAHASRLRQLPSNCSPRGVRTRRGRTARTASNPKSCSRAADLPRQARGWRDVEHGGRLGDGAVLCDRERTPEALEVHAWLPISFGRGAYHENRSNYNCG